MDIASFTKSYPELVVYLNRFLRSRESAFRYTSLQINKDYSSKPHADKNNLGPSRIIGLGNYQGGELWIERKGGSEPLTLQHDVPRYRKGETYVGRKVNIHNRFVEFGGAKLHFTFPFERARCSLIYFKTKRLGRAGLRDLETLRTLCFSLPPVSAQSAYPTEGREKQKLRLKAMKEAGIEPKRKKFHIEAHYDDCGSDLSGLGPGWVHLIADYTVGVYLELPMEVGTLGNSYDPELLMSTHKYTTSFSLWFLHGSEVTASDIATSRPNLRTCQSLGEFVFVSNQHSERDDLVELCGGAARVSTICARRRLRCGGNFDLLTGVDLNDPVEQRKVGHYVRTRHPVVMIISTSCTPFGPPSYVNRNRNYDTWKRSYGRRAPHGRFCGRIALLQLERRRRCNDGSCFLSEHPHPTTLYAEKPWPTVVNDPTVKLQVTHQCMTGQGPNGLPVKKPTGFTSNEPDLLKPLVRYQCDGSHKHDTPCNTPLAATRLWTWTLAHSIAIGVAKVVKKVRGGVVKAYPAAGKVTCPACRDGRPVHDFRRTRDEGCNRPDDMNVDEAEDSQASAEPAPATSSKTASGAASSSTDAPVPPPPKPPEESAEEEWTRFGISASLSVLRHGSDAACLRELRKLHLRWWHIQQGPFANMLQACGMSQKILDLAKKVVKTCRECRQ